MTQRPFHPVPKVRTVVPVYEPDPEPVLPVAPAPPPDPRTKDRGGLCRCDNCDAPVRLIITALGRVLDCNGCGLYIDEGIQPHD